jgi:hypothetical protein
MAERNTFVGSDVHKELIAVALAVSHTSDSEPWCLANQARHGLAVGASTVFN